MKTKIFKKIIAVLCAATMSISAISSVGAIEYQSLYGDVTLTENDKIIIQKLNAELYYAITYVKNARCASDLVKEIKSEDRGLTSYGYKLLDSIEKTLSDMDKLTSPSRDIIGRFYQELYPIGKDLQAQISYLGNEFSHSSFQECSNAHMSRLRSINNELKELLQNTEQAIEDYKNFRNHTLDFDEIKKRTKFNPINRGVIEQIDNALKEWEKFDKEPRKSRENQENVIGNQGQKALNNDVINMNFNNMMNNNFNMMNNNFNMMNNNFNMMNNNFNMMNNMNFNMNMSRNTVPMMNNMGMMNMMNNMGMMNNMNFNMNMSRNTVPVMNNMGMMNNFMNNNFVNNNFMNNNFMNNNSNLNAAPVPIMF